MPPAEIMRAAYGSWKSPVSALKVAAAANVYSEIQLGVRGEVFFLERRPLEQGRYVVLRLKSSGDVDELTPAGFNARTRVHEYGGGSFLVTDETVFFSNFSDQIVYRVDLEGKDPPRPVTFESGIFYADFSFDSKRNRIVCVREDHCGGGEAVNSVAVLDPEGKAPPRILIYGNDFYSTARVSPDGSKLAWLTWNHPHLPFFSSELYVGDILPDGSIGNQQKIAGGPEESIAEPKWSPGGILYFVSDRTNWWNIYRYTGKIESVCELQAEFVRPHWIFRYSSYDFMSDDKIVCAYFRNGFAHLALIHTSSGELQPLDSPFTEIDYVAANRRYAYFRAGSPTSSDAIIKFDFDSNSFETVHPTGNTRELSEEYLSRPEPVAFPTSGGLTAYGLHYPPKNSDFQGPQDELPPLIVISHGGPTSSAETSLDLEIQYWTSRGFAVFDVNYGGSTGYGREYRERLNGKWGVVDVDDCVNGAKFLAGQGKVDENKLIIRGGSAGGYTTLCALTFTKAFKAGASYYGISDLETFVGDTHKFESRYLDLLVGPYPETREVYRKRSAINYLDQISAPVIFFQGLEDKVVPPIQAESMFEALKKKGIPTAYIPFEGEQHGFRKSKNIARSLEAELYFYSRVFGFETADNIEPVKIENLS